MKRLEITLERSERRAQIVRDRIRKCFELLNRGLELPRPFVHAALEILIQPAHFVLGPLPQRVDAVQRVLVFERIREELAQNKTVHAAVDSGFQHAMPAIVDSNLTTVLTALFLFQFGTGPVQGFAVTLIIGILASFLSAVFVTRTFFLIWIQRRPTAAALPI